MGFCGAYTTFSGFTFQTVELLEDEASHNHPFGTLVIGIAARPPVSAGRCGGAYALTTSMHLRRSMHRQRNCTRRSPDVSSPASPERRRLDPPSFYSKLFATEPAKRRPGLRQLRHRRAAAEAGADREPDAGGRSTTSASRSSRPTRSPRPSARLAPTVLRPPPRTVTCCYAVQDKVWVDDPDGVGVIYALVEIPAQAGSNSWRRAKERRPVLRRAHGVVRSRVEPLGRRAARRVPRDGIPRRRRRPLRGSPPTVCLARRHQPPAAGERGGGGGVGGHHVSVGPVSGARLNPVVTLADRVFGGVGNLEAAVCCRQPGGGCDGRRHDGRP